MDLSLLVDVGRSPVVVCWSLSVLVGRWWLCVVLSLVYVGGWLVGWLVGGS